MELPKGRDLVSLLERASVAEAVEQAEVMAQVWPRSGARWLPIADGAAVFTGKGMFANKAGGIGVDRRVTRRHIAELTGFYDECAIDASLVITPMTDESVLRFAGAAGFRIAGFRNQYVRDLRSLPRRGDAIEIVRVTSETEAAWDLVMTDGWGGPVVAARRWNAMIASIEREHRFLAFLDGKPAGTGSVIVSETGVAQLGGMTTRPECRNRGVQTALLQARLRHARTEGCRLAMVDTRPGNVSSRNVERAGFALAFNLTELARARQ